MLALLLNLTCLQSSTRLSCQSRYEIQQYTISVVELEGFEALPYAIARVNPFKKATPPVEGMRKRTKSNQLHSPTG